MTKQQKPSNSTSISRQVVDGNRLSHVAEIASDVKLRDGIRLMFIHEDF